MMVKLGMAVALVTVCLTAADAFAVTALPQLRGSSASQVRSAWRVRGNVRKPSVFSCLASSTAAESVESARGCNSAAQRYWDGMNRRDIEYALAQFSDEIVFQDMMFPEPITSKEGLRAHFEKCLEGFPEGLVFVIDEISQDAGDGRCGAYWHCETPEGKAFPFSRGLSFYKCDKDGKLTFAREIPEPPTKTGGAGLVLAKFGSFMMQFVPESVTFPKV